MCKARTVTQGIGGTWHGRYGSAPCPICQPEGRRDQTALTLRDGRDGRLLAHCKKLGCDFASILAAAGIAPGDHDPPGPMERARREAGYRAEALKRSRHARRCWQETQPIDGTIAETYLRGARGITCTLPDTLRFHATCWHGPSATRHPALVALVQGGDGFALHRTFLRTNGLSKADIEPNKMMLGATGRGAVRLSRAAGPLVLAEGIETALSLGCGFLEGPATIWAALSTSGLRRLCLPHAPGRLAIAADGDAPGRAAAQDLAQRAHAAGWQVSTIDPGDGADFNDHLTGKMVQS